MIDSLLNQDQDRVSDQLHLPAVGPWITGKVSHTATLPALPAAINSLLAAPALRLVEVLSFPRSVRAFFCLVSWLC